MFAFAFLLASLSYIIYFLGLSSLFYPTIIIWIFLLGLLIGGVIVFNHKVEIAEKIKDYIKVKKDKLTIFLVGLLIIQLSIDAIGVLSPETAFDALWYHLTIPKLFLLHHAIYHIPGGLLYYSDMPKLTEMLYSIGLSLHSIAVIHSIQYIFGIATLIAIFHIGKRFFSPKVALVAVVIFSTNIIFHWEVTTAYVDVVRTFYEIMAFWAFLLWVDKKDNKWLYYCSILIGCAIAVKLISFVSVILFSLLIILTLIEQKKSFMQIVQKMCVFILLTSLIPLPYFIFSYIHTHNPFFPLFSTTYPIQTAPIYNPIFFFNTFWHIFTQSSDIISPVYIIFFPLLFVFSKKLFSKYKILFIYTVLGLILWYVIPQRNEERFLLPVLPAFSLLCASVFTLKIDKKLKIFLSGIIGLLLLIAIGYRGLANSRYFPVIFSKEKQATFLTQKLNFSFGDFYDTDGYFSLHIKPNQKVLLYGFHNLYYVDFSFIDRTWVKKGDTFAYIAVQNDKLPKRFADWQKVYENPITHVQLYQKGNKPWQY